MISLLAAQHGEKMQNTDVHFIVSEGILVQQGGLGQSAFPVPGHGHIDAPPRRAVRVTCVTPPFLICHESRPFLDAGSHSPEQGRRAMDIDDHVFQVEPNGAPSDSKTKAAPR